MLYNGFPTVAKCENWSDFYKFCLIVLIFPWKPFSKRLVFFRNLCGV